METIEGDIMDISYPWIGIGNFGLVVRFDGYNKGEVIEAGNSMWHVGDISSHWGMYAFVKKEENGK